MSDRLENCSTFKQIRQSILSNLRVNGDIDVGDIIQLIFQINQEHYPQEPTGIPYNVPDSGTKLVGREKDLKNLCEKLQQNKEVAVIGMGGVGKTKLAKIYARLFCEIYPGGVCWLEARDRDIGLQIVQFAITWGFEPQGKDLNEQVNYCWSHWRKGDVLLVLDDVKHYQDVSQYLRQRPPRFKVLYTTRLQLDFAERLLPLNVLGEQDALKLLQQWVGETKDKQQLTDAKELCQRLGCLPLALDLVGRYVKKQKISLAEMLRRLEQKGLQHRALDVNKSDPTWTLNIERGVAAAFELSWEDLGEDAKQLGCLLSLFPLASFSWKLVEGVKLFKDTKELEIARVQLEDLHLLQGEDDKKSEQIYSLHQLIWEFFHDKLQVNNVLREFCIQFIKRICWNSIPFLRHQLTQKQKQKIKRKFSEGMLEQAKQILDSADFTNPNLQTIIDCLLRRPSNEQDNQFLIEFLNLLFRRYYSFQQYLYDTGYLATAIDKLKEVKKYLEEKYPERLEEPKAKVVIGKMLGHAYYSSDQLGKPAIDKMMAAKEIAADVNQMPNEDSQMWIWYQIFLLDHVHNLRHMRPDIRPDLKYEDLEAQIAELLPDTLEKTTAPPNPNEWFFVLRAAHYWGHRGNQVAFKLENFVSQLPGEIENQTVEGLPEQGIHYYLLAAIMRAVNIRLSFPEQYQQSLAELLQETPYVPEWLKTWNPNLQASDNDFERFASPSQGVGDMAHQYRGIAVVQLFSYAYSAFQGISQSELQLKLEDTSRVVDACIRLWQKAKDKELLAPDEKIIQYYIWTAALTVMLDLAEKNCSGEQLPKLEQEIIPEVNQKLKDLGEEYGLVYERGRERVIKQVRKFYTTLLAADHTQNPQT